MRIVLLGPPGSGKGTRARIISELYGVPHITTGDLLREEVIKGTKIGFIAKPFIDKGELVPAPLFMLFLWSVRSGLNR